MYTLTFRTTLVKTFYVRRCRPFLYKTEINLLDVSVYRLLSLATFHFLTFVVTVYGMKKF